VTLRNTRVHETIYGTTARSKDAALNLANSSHAAAQSGNLRYKFTNMSWDKNAPKAATNCAGFASGF